MSTEDVSPAYRPFVNGETRLSPVLAYLPDLEPPTVESLAPA